MHDYLVTQLKLHQSGCQSSVTNVSLHNKFTKQDLAKLLCNEGKQDRLSTMEALKHKSS